MKSPDEMESAIRQLVSRAVASTEVIDIFAAAGMEKPDISIMSDEFPEEVQALPQRNLALELLKKLINDEIRSRSKKNVVQARSFAEMLEQSVRKYQNRTIETAEVIQELIRLARELREAGKRGETLGLNERQGKALGYLFQHGRLTIQDFEALCPTVNRRSLQRDLKGMLDKNLITAEGATNQLVYRLPG